MKVFGFAEDFHELFKGHTEFYVENNIDLAEVKKAKKNKVKSQPFFKKAKVTESLYNKHLSGTKGLGVCPITDENVAAFGCIDIDDYSRNFQPLIAAIYNNNLPLFPCKSKSGGLHIYFFSKRAVQAKSLIQELERVITLLALRVTFGDKHVEVFPKQAKLTPGTQGSCITLPYYNAQEPISWLWSENMTAFSAEEGIERMKKGRSTISSLSEALDEMELSEAPACVQSIILTSALDKDSGRNNFLFTCAVYLKKKHGESFKEHLLEFNDRLADPLSEQDVLQIYNSVAAREYNYKCKDTPCRSYCNKTECASREYGVGKDKGHFTGLDYGKLKRMLSEDPYYVWDLKFMDADGDYTSITFKDETSLMDQKYFAKMCMRFLNVVPFRMQDNEWFKVLNQSLKDVECVEVPKATDTSVRAEIRETFVKYLTQKQASVNLPVQIKMGFVYVQDDKYYFTHRGFEMFLETERVKLGQENLRELLISYGAKQDTLVYKNKTGSKNEVSCWSKDVDPELRELEDYYSDVFEADENIIDMLAQDAEVDEGEDDDVKEMF